MDEEELPSNSKSSKEKPKEKEKKVISGEVIQRKKPLGRRIRELFIGGEVRGVARYIGSEVILPAIRNLVVDSATKGIDRLVYGDYRPRRPGSPTPYNPRVQYNTYSDPRSRGSLPDQPPLPSRRSRQDATEMVFPTRDEAVLVLERMFDVIDKYGQASVADLYDLVGLPASHVDNKWGWTALANIEVRQIREGWLLELPAAIPLV